jgi:hypothetical protein
MADSHRSYAAFPLARLRDRSLGTLRLPRPTKILRSWREPQGRYSFRGRVMVTANADLTIPFAGVELRQRAP